MAVTIVADWKLERTCDRVFGVCYIEFSPPFDKFDFTQGFTLPNPTHQRCALQSVMTSIEAIRGCAFLRDSQCIILATKHKMVHKLLTDPVCIRNWSKPNSHVSNKTLIRKAFEMLETLDKNIVTFVYVERDENDRAYIDLDEGRTNDGLDMEKMTAKGKTPEEIEEELRKTRMRGVMAQKLLGTGAKVYRVMKKKKE